MVCIDNADTSQATRLFDTAVSLRDYCTPTEFYNLDDILDQNSKMKPELSQNEHKTLLDNYFSELALKSG